MLPLGFYPKNNAGNFCIEHSCVPLNMQVCVGVRPPGFAHSAWWAVVLGKRGGDPESVGTMTPSSLSPWVWEGGSYASFSPR